MGLLDDRVAFVTGTARGMGRNHALRLAREGASIISVDVAPTFHPITDTPPPARPTSRKPLVWWRPRAVHA